MGVLSLIAKLSLNASGFELGLKRSQSLVTRWGKDVGSSVKSYLAAAFGSAAIAAAAKNALDFGGNISDLAKRMNVTAESAQELNYIAEQTGATLEDFAKAYDNVARAQVDALGGSKDALGAFQLLGVSVDDLKNKNADQIFRAIAGSISKTEASSEQLDALFRVMGKSTADLIVAMRDGFDDMINRVRELGIVIDNDMIAKLDEAGDKLGEIQARLRKQTAGATVYGVGKAEEVSAIFSGVQYANAKHSQKSWGDRVLGLLGPYWKDIFEGVDEYNMSIANAVGAVPLKSGQKAKKKYPISIIPKATVSVPIFESAQARTNSLQEVGAYIGVTPMMLEQKNQTTLLKQIAQSTKETATAVKDNPFQ